jgi:hypothetical protein
MSARKLTPGQALTLEIYNDLVSSVQAIEKVDVQDINVGYRIKGVDRRLNQIAIVADTISRQWPSGAKDETITIKLRKMFKGAPVVTASVKTRGEGSDVPMMLSLREVTAQEFRCKLYVPQEFAAATKKKFNYEISFIAIGVERD